MANCATTSQTTTVVVPSLPPTRMAESTALTRAAATKAVAAGIKPCRIFRTPSITVETGCASHTSLRMRGWLLNDARIFLGVRSSISSSRAGLPLRLFCPTACALPLRRARPRMLRIPHHCCPMNQYLLAYAMHYALQRGGVVSSEWRVAPARMGRHAKWMLGCEIADCSVSAFVAVSYALDRA